MDAFVTFLQALATPTIAFAGVWIAFGQKRLADIRLQNDLFDRRFKIFDAARTLIRSALVRIDISHEELREFVLNTADAAFFFDQDILDYLEEVRIKVGRLRILAVVIETPDQTHNLPAAIQEKTEIANWLVAETTEIVTRFRPTMGINQRQNWCMDF